MSGEFRASPKSDRCKSRDESGVRILRTSQSDTEDLEDAENGDSSYKQPLLASYRGADAGLYDGSALPPPYDSRGSFADTRVGIEPGNLFRYPVRAREAGKGYPREARKTVVALAFLVANFVATTVSLSITHERMPTYRPLPDVVLDFFRYQEWALTASEVVLVIQMASTVVVATFHKHRFIIWRRIFLLLGLLYGYRAVTMLVTSVPAANPAYECDPKLADSGQNLTVAIVVMRTVKIMSGFGLSMNGHHVYCGDFIYSGHTMIFLFAYLVVFEYTSPRLFILHWIAWINAVMGVTLLMMARGHYSIDVIVAYFVTTRLWYTYHAMTCHPQLKQASGTNHFARLWWWTLFRWFEENVTSGPIPNGFNCPVPTPVLKFLRLKSRNLVNETSRLTRTTKRKYKEDA